MFATTRRLLVALLLAGSGVVLGQLPAHACTCVRATTQDDTKAAADVFVGTVADSTRSGRLLTYDVGVDRVYKGSVDTETVRVRTPAKASACGLGELATDRRYLFFANRSGDTLRAGSCGGTGPATADLVGKVERLLGDGRTATPPEPQHAQFTRVADAEPASLTRLAAPGLALVIVGLLGLAVVRRLGRRGQG